MAKIEELKYVPIINVLDEAQPAAKKHKPKRRMITLVGFLIGFIGSVGYVYINKNHSNEVGKILKIFKENRNIDKRGNDIR